MALRIIPAKAAIARAVSVIGVSPIVNVIPFEKPKPQTNITPVIIRFLDFVRSTWFSTTFLTPINHTVKHKGNTADNRAWHC